MQLGLNKQLQPHEIKSYKHKIKNQTSKNRKQCAIHKVQKPHVLVRAQKDFSTALPSSRLLGTFPRSFGIRVPTCGLGNFSNTLVNFRRRRKSK